MAEAIIRDEIKFTSHFVLGVDFIVAGDSNLGTSKFVENENEASRKSDCSSQLGEQALRHRGAKVRASPMFRQSDLSRALRAAQTAGLPVSGFEIAPDGRIVIRTVEDGVGDKAANDWD